MTEISDEAVEAALKAWWITLGKETQIDAMRAALLAAAPFIRAAEREECAKIADEEARLSDAKFEGVAARSRDGAKNMELAGAAAIGMDHSARKIAAAIRARQSEGESK